MKGAWKKLKRGEKGQALIIVVILLAIGGLIIAPLLNFMSAGLVSGQVYEVKMEALYAADAGIEYACWKLFNGETPQGGQPFCDMTDINGMDVEVVQLGTPVEVGEGTLYTLKSTAQLEGETEAEIIAQIIAEVGTVGQGGEGGEYKTNEEMAALSVLDAYSIIFTTANNSEFWGREDDKELPGVPITPCDLGRLDISTGLGSLYLDGDDVMVQPKYNINGVHYYHDNVDGYDYLLMTLKTSEEVGTPPVTFSNNDIFRLHIDPDDPLQWQTELLYTIDADLIGLSARGLGDSEPANDVILFCMSDNNAVLGGIEFHNGDIIEYYPSTGDYALKVDVEAILGEIGEQPVLIFDCLSILSDPGDPRLLMSFTSDAGVWGSNGRMIQAEDIAIWEPGEDGIPNTEDDTINLHISMTEETIVPRTGLLIVVSWEIS